MTISLSFTKWLSINGYNLSFNQKYCFFVLKIEIYANSLKAKHIQQRQGQLKLWIYLFDKKNLFMSMS